MKSFEEFLDEGAKGMLRGKPLKLYDPIHTGWAINLGGGATTGSWKPDEEEDAKAALAKYQADPKTKNATLFAHDQKGMTINARTLAAMKKKVSK